MKRFTLHTVATVVMAAFMLLIGINTAQASDLYVGGNIGQSMVRDWGSGDDTDVAFKAYMGVTVSDIVDFRAGYTNLGKASYSDDSGYSDEFKSQGGFAEALLKFKPSNELALFGKLGVAYMRSTATVSDGFSSYQDSSSDIVFVPGVGVNYDINGNIGLTAEYEYYLNVGDKDKTGQYDVGVLSAGVYFRL